MTSHAAVPHSPKPRGGHRTLTVGLCLAAAVAWSTIARATNYPLASDPPAEIRFTVDAPLDSIVGLSRAVSGNLAFDPETLAFGPSRVVVDANAFRTGIGLRDRDLREQFLETDRFPEMALQLQKLSRTSADKLPAGGHLTADVTGLFSLHGITRQVSFTAYVDRSPDGANLAVRATFPVVLADYAIKRPVRLFLKLGEVARVDLHASFLSAALNSPGSSPASPAAANPLVANAAPPATSAAAAKPELQPQEVPTAARRSPRKFPPKAIPKELLAKVKPLPEPHFRFPFNTSEGRGERMLSDASIGGPGNAVACAGCHSTEDERVGLQRDGLVKPSHTLFDVARRGTLWQGFAKTVGKASSLCAKMYMLEPEGLDEGKQKDLEAYLTRLSPDDVVPDLDYRALILTKKTGLANPTAGDARRGEKLAEVYCEGCHGIGQQRPPLTVGLYEPDYLVQRVRWLPGTDARQMPPMYLDRLTDRELRDIVTYLAGDESQRIFKRDKVLPAGLKPDEAAPSAPPGKPASTKASGDGRASSGRGA